jgi:hypothetical protein
VLVKLADYLPRFFRFFLGGADIIDALEEEIAQVISCLQNLGAHSNDGVFGLAVPDRPGVLDDIADHGVDAP